MKNSKFLKVVILLALLFSACNFQDEEAARPPAKAALNARFDKYELVKVSPESVFDNFERLGKGDLDVVELPRNSGSFWVLYLHEDKFLSDDFEALSDGEPQKSNLSRSEVKRLKGWSGTQANDGVNLLLTREYLGGTIMENGELWFIEPLILHDPAAGDDDYIVYSEKAILGSEAQACAVDAQGSNSALPQLAHEPELSDRGANCFVLEVRAHADFEFYQQAGYNYNLAVFSMLLSLNNAEKKFDPIGLDFTVLSASVLTAPQSPLYYPKSSNIGNLLSETMNFWEYFYSGTERDVTVLFTGKNTDPYAGVAVIGSFCSPYLGSGYAVIRNYPSQSVMTANIVAHEIGHVLGAKHTNGTYYPNFCSDSECANYNGIPGEIMYAGVKNNSNAWFSNCSKKEMQCHLFFHLDCLHQHPCE